MFVGYFFPAKKKRGGNFAERFQVGNSKPTETGLPLTAQEQWKKLGLLSGDLLGIDYYAVTGGLNHYKYYNDLY